MTYYTRKNDPNLITLKAGTSEGAIRAWITRRGDSGTVQMQAGEGKKFLTRLTREGFQEIDAKDFPLSDKVFENKKLGIRFALAISGDTYQFNKLSKPKK